MYVVVFVFIEHLKHSDLSKRLLDHPMSIVLCPPPQVFSAERLKMRLNSLLARSRPVRCQPRAKSGRVACLAIKVLELRIESSVDA